MKSLRTIFAVCMLLMVISGVEVFAQNITTPRIPSPAASVSQTVGISTITVRYARPAVKGRTVWGELVPYGWNVQEFGTSNPAPWRAGANENTVIEFSHDATVEGHAVPAGAYGLFFVINADDSGEIILSRDNRSWGNFFYHPERDLFREKIKIRPNGMTEQLTYDFVNVTKNTAELNLNWEKKQFPVKIEFDVDNIVIANAEVELNGMKGFQFQAYNSAAAYALQNNIALDKALTWINHSMAIGGNTSFNTFRIKAGILRKSGKAADADKVLAGALEVLNEVEVNLYGYDQLNQKNFDKAIEILTLNTVRNPKSANAFDSLGEAFALKGDKKNAILNFKKSLSLNPNDLTKANSEKYLKQLGGK